MRNPQEEGLGFCKHGTPPSRPCLLCQMGAPVCPPVTDRDIRILALESEVSQLRHDLANAQQVAQFAQELMHMGEFTI